MILSDFPCTTAQQSSFICADLGWISKFPSRITSSDRYFFSSVKMVRIAHWQMPVNTTHRATGHYFRLMHVCKVQPRQTQGPEFGRQVHTGQRTRAMATSALFSIKMMKCLRAVFAMKLRDRPTTMSLLARKEFSWHLHIRFRRLST